MASPFAALPFLFKFVLLRNTSGIMESQLVAKQQLVFLKLAGRQQQHPRLEQLG